MGKLTSAGLLLFITAASLFSAQQQQTTAYHAMRLVSQQVNRAALSSVISVTGVNGDPQPTRWTILLADRNLPGGIREIQVANGRIVGNGVPKSGVVGSAENAKFPAAKLNLDSDGAFKVASYTANTAHVNFDSASYALRTNDRGVPFWIVTLQDQSGAALGTIHINATKGNIVRVEGMFRGANMAEGNGGNVEPSGPRVTQRTERVEGEESTEEATSSEDEYVDFNENGEVVEEENAEDENIVKRNIKRMFHRTKEGVQGVFHRARRSFQDFLDS